MGFPNTPPPAPPALLRYGDITNPEYHHFVNWLLVAPKQLADTHTAINNWMVGGVGVGWKGVHLIGCIAELLQAAGP